jgi:hypothetical protein
MPRLPRPGAFSSAPSTAALAPYLRLRDSWVTASVRSERAAKPLIHRRLGWYQSPPTICPAAGRQAGRQAATVTSSPGRLHYGRAVQFPWPSRAQIGAEPRAPWGGDGAAGAPPLTRLTACPSGILWPGFSTACPGRSAFKGEMSYVLSREHHLAGRAASCREGCRERRLRVCRDQGPMPGTSRLVPRRPREVGGTPPPFRPAWRSSAPSDVLARDQDFSTPDGQVWRAAGRRT